MNRRLQKRIPVRTEQQKAERAARLASRAKLAIPRPGQVEEKRYMVVRPDGREIIDRDHPEGDREFRERAGKRVEIFTFEGITYCGICWEPVRRGPGLDIDHIICKGFNGAKHDDREANLQPAHHFCNLEKGSRDGWVKNPIPDWLEAGLKERGVSLPCMALVEGEEQKQNEA